jgi:hypothetical protein
MRIVIPAGTGVAGKRAIVLCAVQGRNNRGLHRDIRVDSDVYPVNY